MQRYIIAKQSSLPIHILNRLSFRTDFPSLMTIDYWLTLETASKISLSVDQWECEILTISMHQIDLLQQIRGLDPNDLGKASIVFLTFLSSCMSARSLKIHSGSRGPPEPNEMRHRFASLRTYKQKLPDFLVYVVNWTMVFYILFCILCINFKKKNIHNRQNTWKVAEVKSHLNFTDLCFVPFSSWFPCTHLKDTSQSHQDDSSMKLVYGKARSAQDSLAWHDSCLKNSLCASNKAYHYPTALKVLNFT